MDRTSRRNGLLIILLIYIIAAAAGAAVFLLLPGFRLLPRLFMADIAATLIVWLTGLPVRNSSVYDPYWSVAPMVMLVLVEWYLRALNPAAVLLTGVILLWGVRLTAHWSTTFHGLRFEDWRYAGFRANKPKLWFFINLFGINLFPTIVVFLVMLPAFAVVMAGGGINTGTVTGAAVSVFAVALQAVSDHQLGTFRSDPENKGKVIRLGLWNYIRHPNYLGEILMWWGVYMMMLSVRPDLWLAGIGPLINTLMFVFISVPLMEKRQLKNKPEYVLYRAETGMLLPKLKSFAAGREEARR